MLKYQRAVLKISGEALFGNLSGPEGLAGLQILASELEELLELGAQMALVVGGGNILRGVNSEKLGINRVKADQAGMLATLINALFLAEICQKFGLRAKVFSALSVPEIAELYVPQRVLSSLASGEVAILACGTGRPFFSTDTAGVLRALELEAQVLLKATKVDGVYDKDPVLYPEAQKFSHLTYQEAINRGLRVMDLTAFSLAKEHQLPIVVFKFPERGSLKAILMGEKVGTTIS